MSQPASRPRIQVGLAVDSRKAVYIIRPSDDELFDLLQKSEYCNVLCSRQMGKTSLLHRTRARLAEKGIKSALIDVAGSLGTVANADDWYLGLVQVLAGEIGLAVDVRAWWQASTAATHNQRMLQFFREQVTGKIDGQVVIFLDEIDSTLKLPYTDDLFVAIRSMYNDRVREPAFERIAFCLVGVATPNELIKEPRTTPYNIGRTIELRDFDPERDDLASLHRAVSDDPATGKAVVREVLRWTGGHPYLTARLCEEAARKGHGAPEDVAGLIEEGYSNLESVERDPHFEQVLRFLKERADDRFATLDLYRRIWRGRREPDRLAPAHVRLKLAGIVKRDARGLLAVRNPIYRRIFTSRWARAAMPATGSLPVGAKTRSRESRLRVTRYVAVAAAVFAALGVLPVAWQVRASQQIDILERALDDYSVASKAYRSLRQIPFHQAQADELWARLFERRALRAEATENRDQAILWRLKAQAVANTPKRARRSGALAGSDYNHLLATLHAGTLNTPNLAIDFAPQLVAFSPDGQSVITGSFDNIARLWRTSDGSPIAPPLRHSGSVLAVAFSPDGRLVITGSLDKTARLWRTSDGSPIAPPLRHSGSVLAVAFSPDGRFVVTGSADNTARLWHASDGSPVARPLESPGSVITVAFSPDGHSVITGNGYGTACLWRVSDGSPIARPLIHLFSVLAVAFSPSGQSVITGSSYGVARIWSASDGSPIGHPLIHSASVRAIAFSSDGKSIITGSGDNTARLWRASDGSPISQPLVHSDSVLAVAFSPDGHFVITGSADGTARLWRASDGSPIGPPFRHSSSVLAVAFSPVGHSFITGSSDGTARIWRASNDSPVIPTFGASNPILAVAFSPDGQSVITGGRNNTARIWRAYDGSPVAQLLEELDPSLSVEDELDWVRAVAFGPNGQSVITGNSNATARIWRTRDGSPVAQPLVHSSSVRAVAFSPDGQSVITGSSDNTARLWRVADGLPIAQQLEHSDWVRAVAFSPDSQIVLTGSDDGTARLWRSSDGSVIAPPLKHSSWVRAVAFNPDGSKVITGSSDGAARLWRASDGSPIAQPMNHSSPVRAVTFSPDGSGVITATNLWIHEARISDTVAAMASVLLPSPFLAFRNSDSSGRRMQIAVAPTGDSVQVLDLEPGNPSAEPLEGDPAQLLKEWQQKLGLRLDEQTGVIEAVR